MDFQSLSFIFNRAWNWTFCRKKALFVFIFLFLGGLLAVVCRGLALHAGPWVQLSLTFLPLFLCSALLLFLGILLIRLYREEVKKQEVAYGEMFSRSWMVALGASYFVIPLILGYLLLWILLGVFVLLSEIPMVGSVFSILLSFAPFLINLGTLILCVISLAALFFLAPVVAFKGLEGQALFQTVLRRLERDPLTNLVLILVALFPFALMMGLLLTAALLTSSVSAELKTPLERTLQWFFIMIPFTAFLTPTVIFFFNFAAEAHVWMQKKIPENAS